MSNATITFVPCIDSAASHSCLVLLSIQLPSGYAPSTSFLSWSTAAFSFLLLLLEQTNKKQQHSSHLKRHGQDTHNAYRPAMIKNQRLSRLPQHEPQQQLHIN